MHFARLVLFAPLVLTACVQPPVRPPQPAPPVARPVTSTPPPPSPAANWADRRPASGAWTYTRDSRGSIARYGDAGAMLFSIRCDAGTAGIYVSRPGSNATRLTLRSTNGAKSYVTTLTAGAQPIVTAQIAAGDPQLDSMAFSRGRILIGLEGDEDVILPIWPEFTRVVEDCRG